MNYVNDKDSYRACRGGSWRMAVSLGGLFPRRGLWSPGYHSKRFGFRPVISP